MESPGEYLKRERELRRASLTSIFEGTRVPLKYLEAIEADDYESLPHPTFVKGFIKSYCKHLGLDETDAVLRYEIYMKERTDKAEPSRPALTIKRTEPREQPKEGRVFNNSWAIAALAGCALVIVISYSLYSKHKAKMARLNEVAQASQAAVTPPPPVPAVATQPPVSPEEGPKAAPKKAAPAAEASDSADSTDSAEESHTLVISANEVVWIKVKIDGGEPFDVVLKKGESVVWKATESFSLVVGNAGGVSLVYDGEKLSNLGKSGEVVTLKLPRA
jgi:cytoskeleton protein RodZ